MTEPKYKVASWDLPEESNEEKQTAYQDELENTHSTDIDERPNGDNDLLQSLPPILDELAGHEPGTW